jgi:hypothetical protein
MAELAPMIALSFAVADLDSVLEGLRKGGDDHLIRARSSVEYGGRSVSVAALCVAGVEIQLTEVMP